jgi:hypothetical protein
MACPSRNWSTPRRRLGAATAAGQLLRPGGVDKPLTIDGGGAVTIDAGGKGTVFVLAADDAVLRGLR